MTRIATDSTLNDGCKVWRPGSDEPDPITTLTEFEKAYLAGLTDGEGNISVKPVGPKHLTVYPVFFMGTTDRELMRYLCIRLQAGRLVIHNTSAMKKHPAWKPQYQFQLFGKRAKRLCVALLPYLRTKRPQAELVLKFPLENTMQGPGNFLSPEVNNIRLKLCNEMHMLNAKTSDKGGWLSSPNRKRWILPEIRERPHG